MARGTNGSFPPSKLSVQILRERPGVITAAVGGELDISTAAGLSDPLSAELEATPGHHLLLDLEGLRFMDAAGLRALSDLRDRARPGRVVLARPRSPVTQLLTLAGLDRSLAMVDSLGEGMELLAGPGGSGPPAAADER